jgi:hypothetical protein
LQSQLLPLDHPTFHDERLSEEQKINNQNPLNFFFELPTMNLVLKNQSNSRNLSFGERCNFCEFKKETNGISFVIMVVMLDGMHATLLSFIKSLNLLSLVLNSFCVKPLETCGELNLFFFTFVVF